LYAKFAKIYPHASQFGAATFPASTTCSLEHEAYRDYTFQKLTVTYNSKHFHVIDNTTATGHVPAVQEALDKAT